MYGPKWPFLLKYESHDTRCIDFSQVDELSTNTPILGRHTTGEVEVHMEPLTETTPVAEPKRQEEEQNLAQKGRKQKRA